MGRNLTILKSEAPQTATIVSEHLAELDHGTVAKLVAADFSSQGDGDLAIMS